MDIEIKSAIVRLERFVVIVMMNYHLSPQKKANYQVDPSCLRLVLINLLKYERHMNCFAYAFRTPISIIGLLYGPNLMIEYSRVRLIQCTIACMELSSTERQFID